MKSGEMLSLLYSLGYSIKRQKGSHKHLECPNRPRVLFAFHDGATIPPGLVRKILLRDAGLTPEEAAGILGLKG